MVSQIHWNNAVTRVSRLNSHDFSYLATIKSRKL